MLGFKKTDISYYNYKDINIRPFYKTGNVYIGCDRSELIAQDKFVHYEEALPIIVELL